MPIVNEPGEDVRLLPPVIKGSTPPPDIPTTPPPPPPVKSEEPAPAPEPPKQPSAEAPKAPPPIAISNKINEAEVKSQIESGGEPSSIFLNQPTGPNQWAAIAPGVVALKNQTTGTVRKDIVLSQLINGGATPEQIADYLRKNPDAVDAAQSWAGPVIEKVNAALEGKGSSIRIGATQGFAQSDLKFLRNADPVLYTAWKKEGTEGFYNVLAERVKKQQDIARYQAKSNADIEAFAYDNQVPLYGLTSGRKLTDSQWQRTVSGLIDAGLDPDLLVVGGYITWQSGKAIKNELATSPSTVTTLAQYPIPADMYELVNRMATKEAIDALPQYYYDFVKQTSEAEQKQYIAKIGLDKYKDAETGRYNLAKYLRDKPNSESSLIKAGFSRSDINETKDWNRRYLGTGIEPVKRETFVSQYFTDKGWGTAYPTSIELTDNQYRSRIAEANAAYDREHGAPMTFSEYERAYFDDKGYLHPDEYAKYVVDHQGEQYTTQFGTKITVPSLNQARFQGAGAGERLEAATSQFGVMLGNQYERDRDAALKDYVKKFGTAPVIQQTFDNLADFVVPGYYVATNWTDLNVTEKIFNIAIDALFVASFLGKPVASVVRGAGRVLGDTAADAISRVARYTAKALTEAGPIETKLTKVYQLADSLESLGKRLNNAVRGSGEAILDKAGTLRRLVSDTRKLAVLKTDIPSLRAALEELRTSARAVASSLAVSEEGFIEVAIRTGQEVRKPRGPKPGERVRLGELREEGFSREQIDRLRAIRDQRNRTERIIKRQIDDIFKRQKRKLSRRVERKTPLENRKARAAKRSRAEVRRANIIKTRESAKQRAATREKLRRKAKELTKPKTADTFKTNVIPSVGPLEQAALVWEGGRVFVKTISAGVQPKGLVKIFEENDTLTNTALKQLQQIADQTGAGIGVGSGTGTGTSTRTAVGSGSQGESEGATSGATFTRTRTSTQTEAETKTKPAFKTGEQAAAETKAKTETKPSTKSEIETRVKTGEKTEVKPDTRFEPITPPISPPSIKTGITPSVRTPKPPAIKPPRDTETLTKLTPKTRIREKPPKEDGGKTKIKLPIEQEQERKKKLLSKPPRKTITYKQGLWWWTFVPPYKTQADVIKSKKPPKGATVVTGPGSAYKTIQSLGGNVNIVLTLDYGNQDVKIKNPRTKAGTPGAIKFKLDKGNKTRSDINIAGIGGIR